MDLGVRSIVSSRLEADGSAREAWVPLVFAALEGPDGLEAALAGSAAAQHAGAVQASPAPAGAFLQSIAVEGFRGIGPAQTLDESGLQAGGVHRPGDGLAAAVHDDRVDAHRFKEHDVARHPVAHLRLGRIHETAAIFHDERLAAETLDVRQRLQQRRGFGNQVFHRPG